MQWKCYQGHGVSRKNVVATEDMPAKHYECWQLLLRFILTTTMIKQVNTFHSWRALPQRRLFQLFAELSSLSDPQWSGPKMRSSIIKMVRTGSSKTSTSSHAHHLRLAQVVRIGSWEYGDRHRDGTEIVEESQNQPDPVGEHFREWWGYPFKLPRVYMTMK